MWNHWVARANYPHQPFKEFEDARWAWRRLEDGFPEMVAAVLMPNHLHLLLPSDLDGTKHFERRIGGFLGAISQREGLQYLWPKAPPPTQIVGSDKLWRQFRYFALNPCRKGLCSDPLEWVWSTYRDVMGATVEAPDQEKRVYQVARLLGVPLPESVDEYSARGANPGTAAAVKKFQVRFHAFVSADPSVCVEGTPPPIPAIPTPLANAALLQILVAAASALRVSPCEVRTRGPLRTLFFHLAVRHGWTNKRLLAKLASTTPRGVLHALKKEPPLGLAEADLCLGDPRLRPRDFNMDWLK